MPQQEGRNRFTIEFHLTPEEQLHVFAQWREKNPNAKLDNMSSRGYWSAVKDELSAHGWQAVAAKLPDAIELKKIDYKAILKGILPA